ncbi:hypothetical protein Bcoa_0285 [Heyndrickxia coagulans 36D1]|uniref:WXG100 family type VII secretion target n=1 Tax=Heyndrickxia coagulans 36D1 TaxID=345219 RepID=G2TML7_HEYCO|nr:hypothetical protein Bcoa_0285 [Heyndrickxia coagulans 36D1]
MNVPSDVLQAKDQNKNGPGADQNVFLHRLKKTKPSQLSTELSFTTAQKDKMMVAGQIRMTPEELKAKAQRYGNAGQQIEQLLRDLTNLQNELRGEWEGRAFQGFDDQFNQLKPKVQNFAQLMHDINTQLNKTADAVAQHDEELSRNFGLQ